MGTPRTHIVLWLLAGLGLYLYLSQPGVVSHTTTAAAHPANLAASLSSILAGVLPAVIRFVLWAIALVLLVMGILSAYRYHMRVRRAMQMRIAEIILGPDDTATPYEVMSALDAIHGQMLTRYGGTAMGQNSFSFEIVRKDDSTIHFLLAAPYEWLKALEDTWRSKYTNLRFQDWKEIPHAWVYAQQIVLTKHWRHATETVKDYQNSVVETMVQALDRAQGECHLQYLLTPLPMGPMNAQLRQHVQNIEYRAKQQQTTDPAAPGVGYAESQVVKDALQLYGKSVFRVEMRLAADDWNSIQRVYGALQEANGENTFRASTVWIGKNIWVRWLYLRMPSVLLFRQNIMFSFPLATILHLPTARLRINSLNRMLVRRGPAPLFIPRDEKLAILQDEIGPIGIPESDRKYNLLMIGSQGSGKSTDIQNIIKVDSRHTDDHGRNKAIVLIDIGKDTAKRAMGVVPANRKVIWFDPSDPDCPWTVNPMLASINEAVLADNVLEGLTEVFGDEAIRFRSREFLGNSIMAVKDVMKDQSDFTHVYQLLTDEQFRTRIIQNVQDPHQRQYWQITFTNAMTNNPRFLEEGLAAPRNKLDEVLRNPLIRAALETKSGRQQINMQEIIDGRAVFIANLDKSKLGKSGARLLGILLITMLWHALQAQTDVPESERIPVSLILDEAQNFISEGFLDILAEGRAYGAQTTIAVRFLGEIASEKVIQGLQALAQNLIVHQFELLDEAEVFMKRFMRVYANMVQVGAESQDALNFGADDFMRLPKYQAVCRFMVNGTPQQAFLAQTIPWEQFYDDGVRKVHLNEQPMLAGALRSIPTQDGPEAVPLNPTNPSADQQPSHKPLPTGPIEPPASTRPEPLPEERALLPGQSPLILLELLLGKDAAARLLATAQDELTGLLSRQTWNRALASVPQEGNVVVFFDVDGLKETNDSQGHSAGDVLIKTAAMVLQTLARQDDIVARYGGDEFVLLIHGMSDSDFPVWGRRAREAFRAAGVGVSIGGAVQKPSESLEDALKRADKAMYQDKNRRKAGRGTAKSESNSEGRGEAPKSRSESTRKNVDTGPATEGPDQWSDNDPRRVLCERYTVQPAKLLSMAQDATATDRELRESCKWLLENHISPETLRVRLQRLLALKVEDRVLHPVAQRLQCDLKTLREALIAVDATAAQAVEVVQSNASVQTIAQLQAALMPGQSLAR